MKISNYDLLKLSGKRNEIAKTRRVETGGHSPRRNLHENPINSDLKLARQHFEAGNFSAARAIPWMPSRWALSLDDLLQREEHLQQQQAQVQGSDG